jgi:multicomponent Na+:H+ antiporter subunit D
VVTYDHGIAMVPPIAITVPILVACVLVAVGRRLPRVVNDGIAFVTAAAEIAMLAVVLARAADGRVVTWAARWEPKHGYSVGIVLVSDPIGVTVALVAAALVLLAFVYSWRYFDAVEAHFHALILLFLAGMVGFALTGDLFDLFVFFELMGAAAYALTGYKIEDETAVQGALNFGIVNSLGAYISLMGIGLLYARVGNLTMPQLSEALAHRHVDALVVVGFVAVSTGFLVKAALVPFHFWLADAHAVAPTPVCVLFSGVMVPLGLYGALRVYWVVFSRALPAADVRRTFLVLGALTAIVGAVMCLAQRHFKRLLAYSTIAHVGLFVVAAATLTDEGTAGAALYVAGHAGVKCALFLLAGTMLNRYGSVDEVTLFGRGRDARFMPWLFVVAGLALAGLPPFGTSMGKAIGEEAGLHAGYVWVPVLFVLASAATGAAVLRATGRVYFGLGTPPPCENGEATSGDDEKAEVAGLLARVPVAMLVPILVLLLGSLALGVVPGTHEAAEHAAGVFTDPVGYAREALTGRLVAPRPSAPVGNWTLSRVVLGFASALLAVAIAAAGLFGRRSAAATAAARVGRPVLAGLRRLHSGMVTDYVAWLLTGVVALGALVGLPMV